MSINTLRQCRVEEEEEDRIEDAKMQNMQFKDHRRTPAMDVGG